MNMTAERLQTLWEMVNDQMEGVEKEDAEFVCEQWWAEISCPRTAMD